MPLEHLSLQGFRSYSSAQISFSSKKPVVITGCNGAGKTNFLEAISLLAPGKGLRGCSYADMGENWQIKGHIAGAEGEVRVHCAFTKEKNKRTMQVNEQPLRKLAQITPYFHVSWLTPENMFWVTMSERRRFLDRCVTGMFGEHWQVCTAYDRLMRERNRLLSFEAPNLRWLNSLEEQMAVHAQSILMRRLDFLVLIGQEQGHCGNIFPHPALSMKENFSQDLAAVLQQSRAADKAAKRTLCGPHASELMIYHPTKKIEGRFCSTGEQKLMLLSLILKYATMVSRRLAGASLILLLDEAVAHLDRHHRAVLFEEIADAPWQTFMTGTDVGLFDSMPGGSILVEVREGTLLS